MGLAARCALVGFGIDRIEPQEPVIHMDPAYHSDCKTYQLEPLEEYPFYPSGGWANDDPLVPFWRAYYEAPELRLPAGTWRIRAEARFSTGAGCNDVEHELDAAVTVVVKE
jgi:hypothetical protein